MEKLILMVSIMSLWACKPHAIDDMVTGDSSLASVEIAEPKLDQEDLYDTVTLELSCLNCSSSEGEKALVDRDIPLTEKMSFASLTELLAEHQYTEGREIKLALKFYKGEVEEPVLASCEGDAPGCSDYYHRLIPDPESGRYHVLIRLAVLAQEAVGRSADIIITTLEPELTKDISEIIDASRSHCIATRADGSKHAGRISGGQCYYAFSNRVESSQVDIEYFKKNPALRYFYIDKAELMDQKPAVYGKETRGGTEYPMYVCRSGSRVGKTSLSENGSGNLWPNCHLSVDGNGVPLESRGLVSDYQLLVYEIR